MSLNLIDLMKDQLTGAIAGQIGNQLGVDQGGMLSGLGETALQSWFGDKIASIVGLISKFTVWTQANPVR